MTALEEIMGMPLKDRILAAEAIWAGVYREKDEMGEDIPDWHKEILEERIRLVDEGKSELLDWEEAKKQIRSSIQ